MSFPIGIIFLTRQAARRLTRGVTVLGMEAVVSDPTKALSALVRDRRRAAGLTQRQLADAAQVNIGVLRDLEQGVTAHPRPQVVESLATALHLEPPAAPPAKPASSGHPTVSVRLRVLGPLTAWRNGAVLALGPASQQAVLGLLTLNPNTPLHRNRISEALWDDEPPPSASTMIQSYVSRLRRILDPGRPAQARDGLLVSTTTGYRLQVTEDQLDLIHFLRLARQARDAQAAGDAAAACVAYEQALVLWRGEPLQDIGEPLQDIEVLRSHPAIAGLARQRDSAIMEFAEAVSQLGAHSRVLRHLAELTQRDPLNERAHACYMIALAGTGQQAAALEVFEQLRHRLGDELGLRPGPELNRAQQQVLRQHVSIAPPPAAPGPAKDAPPVCQLPPAVADFTGRETEIAQLTDLLSADESRPGVPIAMISGLPGVGKTALALRVAHKIRSAFPDGQLWAQLDGATQHPRDPGDVLGELLRALGVHGSAIPKSSAERASLYRSRLAGQRVLVLADDAASADQVRPLLPGTRESAVLITSRTGLAGPAGSRIIQLDPLTQAEAVQLLTWIVGEKRVTAEPQAAHELAAACGQLPLAVRIAGAKLATRTSWQLSVLAGKIANERRRLDELEAGDMSVRASLSQSYQTLDEPAQRAFRLLASLGPAEVAEWVVAALIDQPDAANVVGQLTDKSLLTPVGMDGTGQPRYRLHDLLRDYAAEQLANEPHALQDAAIRRTMNGWLQLAALADAGLPREPYFPQPADRPPTAVVPDALAKDLTTDPMAWFTAERLNLLAAIERCCSLDRHHAAAQLGSYLASFQYLQGRWDDAERIWGVVIAACRSPETQSRSFMLSSGSPSQLAMAGTPRQSNVEECAQRLDESIDRAHPRA